MEVRRTNKFMFFVTLWLIVVQFAIGFVYVAVLEAGGELPSTAANLLLSQLLMNILPLGVYIAVTKQRLTDVVPLKNPGVKNVVLVVLAAFAAIPVMSFINVVSQFVFANYVQEALTDVTGGTPYWAGLMVIALSPAIFEEAMYRGAILSGYKTAPVILAAVMSGLYFGVMHMNANQFMYACVLGFIFALVVRWSGSIVLSSVFHFVVNAFSVTAMYLASGSTAAADDAALVLPEGLDAETAEIAQKMIDFINANPLVIAAVFLGIVCLAAVPALILILRAVKRNCVKTGLFADTEYERPNLRGDFWVWGTFALFLAFAVYMFVLERTV